MGIGMEKRLVGRGSAGKWGGEWGVGSGEWGVGSGSSFWAYGWAWDDRVNASISCSDSGAGVVAIEGNYRRRCCAVSPVRETAVAISNQILQA